MSSEAMKYIESVAQESPNRYAFYRGMVFGLAQSLSFMKKFEKTDVAIAWVEVLLNEIDEEHFKKEQT